MDKIERKTIAKNFYNYREAEKFAKIKNIPIENIMKDKDIKMWVVVENPYAEDYVCAGYEDTNY
jgi:hypothetical protein